MAKEKKRGLAAEEKLIRTRDLDPPARIVTAQGPRDEQTFFPEMTQTMGAGFPTADIGSASFQMAARLWRSVAQRIVSEQAKRDKRRFGGSHGRLNRLVAPTVSVPRVGQPGIRQKNSFEIGQ
jgi:hypothetical protein